VTLPGPIGGNRPGAGGGGIQWPGGNRPGWANRPGAGGGGIQWPGGNRPPWNRPGWNGGGTQWPGGNRPGGGNWAGGGNRPPWGIGNRPGGIGNGNWGNGNWGIGGGNNIGSGNVTGGNTIGSGNTIVNNNGGWGGGGWRGGGWGGGGWGGGGWGGGGWGGGWASPYYGNWYRGGWGGNGFWAGFGTGALTSFGLGTLGSVLGYGGLGFGYPSYYSGFGVYDYFPTWGVSNYSSWGLGSLASNWLYGGYTNPYYSSLVAAQPAQTTVIYDYSQPINVAAEAPNSATASSSEQVFSAARDAFMASDYQRALDLADQVIKDTPNVPVVHEFRGLCLFALKRFDEAAAVEYAVLSSGPGWNWATLVGLYPDVETYTNQLRALEASVRSNPNSPSLQFLLAYHYMIQGHKDAAASQFAKVAQLQPNDQLSASFVKALKKVLEQPQQQATAPASTTVASNTQPASAAPATVEQPQEQPELPPPPPASLVGTWKAQPSADLAIALTLQADGQFTWEVDSKGQKQTLTGQAGFKDGMLALLQEEGPPLVGKVAQEGESKFTFSPPTGASAQNPGLTFTKS
jgi:tetratricopeptide (TPR) repeat protein